jgi:hypothetical protein
MFNPVVIEYRLNFYQNLGECSAIVGFIAGLVCLMVIIVVVRDVAEWLENFKLKSFKKLMKIYSQFHS